MPAIRNKNTYHVFFRKGNAHGRYAGDVQSNSPEKAYEKAMKRYREDIDKMPGETTEFYVKNTFRTYLEWGK